MKRIILIHFSLYSLTSGPHPDLTSSQKLIEIDYNRGIDITCVVYKTLVFQFKLSLCCNYDTESFVGGRFKAIQLSNIIYIR